MIIGFYKVNWIDVPATLGVKKLEGKNKSFAKIEDFIESCLINLFFDRQQYAVEANCTTTLEMSS
jgi:hypothetical protein